VAFSAHANPLVATQTYTATAAAQREFPAGLPVWRAACLNCHDTHTVPGARRLVREGTDSVATPKAGGASAIEENCYQCHTTAAQSAITPVTTVPDVRTDFQLARRMPIRSADQAAVPRCTTSRRISSIPAWSTARGRRAAVARISSSRVPGWAWARNRIATRVHRLPQPAPVS